MESPRLKLDREGAVAVVRLNRPQARNAMDEATLAELAGCFRRLGKEEAVRAVILRGEGPDFCAGADIRWMRRAADYSPAKNRSDARRLVEMIRAVDECPKPVLARVHGGIYGGGLGLVAACDIVAAEERSVFCFSECRLGILPAVVSSFVLPKVGLSQARRLYLTAETFSAPFAREIGLVHEVCPEAELDARLKRFVQDILRNGPKALGVAKAYLRKLSALPREARIRFSIEALVKARSSEEGKEGLSAFLERRPPGWAR